MQAEGIEQSQESPRRSPATIAALALRVCGRSIKASPDADALQQEAAISDILTAQKGPILEITLNRPQDGNAASDEMAEELTKLLLGAETAEIIVLRGAGNDFCVGRSTAGRGRPATRPMRWSAVSAATWCSIATTRSGGCGRR